MRQDILIKSIYYSIDGKKFENAEECVEHDLKVCKQYYDMCNQDKVAEWIPVEGIFNLSECSMCGKFVVEKTKYCPNCGRRCR